MVLPNGYEMKSTFYMDFSIADQFGIGAIKNTYKRAFENWKDNYVYLTELVITLNYKIWESYGKKNDYAEIYNELWIKADEYACDNLQGEEIKFFFRITD